MLGVDDLLVLQTFNIAYDTGIFFSERQRANLSGIHLNPAGTGARLTEVVDNEKKKPRDGSCDALWGPKRIEEAQELGDDDASGGEATYKPPDKNSRLLEEMLKQETEGGGVQRRFAKKTYC